MRKLIIFLSFFVAIRSFASSSLEITSNYGVGNFYQFGVGVRAGTLVYDNIYLGANTIHYFGQTTKAIGLSFRNWSTLAQIEGGYRFPISEKFAILPYLGIGINFLTNSSENSDSIEFESSKKQISLNPGARLQYDFNSYLISFDVNYIGTANFDGFATGLSVGFRF